MTKEQLNYANEVSSQIFHLENEKIRLNKVVEGLINSFTTLEELDTDYKEKFDDLKDYFSILIDAKIQAYLTVIEQI